MITTLSHVAQYVADVTPEQIGKCTRITGPNDKAYFSVESERGDRCYAVRYNCKTGFSCTCPAGADGFLCVYNPSRVCKHCRWVVAFILEERAYSAELIAAQQARRVAGNSEVAPAQDTPIQPPAWYDPANETSFYYGTRRTLIKIGSKEADEYSEAEIKRAQEENAPHSFKFFN